MGLEHFNKRRYGNDNVREKLELGPESSAPTCEPQVNPSRLLSDQHGPWLAMASLLSQAYVMSDDPRELEEGWVVVMKNGLRLKVKTEVPWRLRVTAGWSTRGAVTFKLRYATWRIIPRIVSG